MFFYYNVFLVDGDGNHIKHIDMVAALSESSGWGYDNFKAERC
jgi:hypothetical protein